MQPAGTWPGRRWATAPRCWTCPKAAFCEVVDLSLVGTLLPFRVFGAAITSGASVNVSSMAADRAITRVVGYAAAKGASFVTDTIVPRRRRLQRVQRGVTTASARRTRSRSGRSREDVPVLIVYEPAGWTQSS